MKKIFLIFMTLTLILSLGCNPGKSNEDWLDDPLVMLILLNPCFTTASPIAGSGLASETILNNNSAAAVKGKIISSTGAPVVNALVIVDNNGVGEENDSIHYSTYSGINRDGTFEISGIRIADGPFILGVEPIDQDTFANRIDTHIDCFMTHKSFTAGWFTGNGGTITTTRASASTITLTSGEIEDIGTVKLID